MPVFAYTVKSITGETKSGTQEAASENELAREFRNQGLVLTSVKTAENSAKIKSRLLNFLPNIIGVPLAEKMIFTRHLAVMIGAGLSLNKSLDALAKQTPNRAFSKIVQDASDNIRKGQPLADSLARHPQCFSEMFINMIKVGETGGGLEDILKILAHQMEKEHELKSKVRGAMIYPIIVIAAMIGIGILMMVMVVPKLTQIFKEMQTELPLSTKLIIATSDFLNQHFIMGIIGFFTAIIAIRTALKTSKGRLLFDYLILKTPIFGQMSRKINSARLARTLGSLIEGGVPIVEGISIVSGTMSNYLFRDSLKEAASAVQKGEKFSQTLKSFPKLYLPMVPQMIEVGEETGTLGTILLKLADFYEEEVSEITKSMASIIEPVLMVIIGAAVGLFAVSMIQPMYSLMQGM